MNRTVKLLVVGFAACTLLGLFFATHLYLLFNYVHRIAGYAEQMATPIADIRSWLANAFEGHHLPHRFSL